MRTTLKAIVAGTALILGIANDAGAADRFVYTEVQKMGNGFAQVYARLGEDGAPLSIGFSFDQGVLESLPAEPNNWSRCFDKNKNGRFDARGECNGDYELAFALPYELTRQSKSAFSWIGFNWNPEGHPPPAPPPWAVPHFDFHFYTQSEADVRGIGTGPCAEYINCDDFKRAQKPVPRKYVHPDHIDVGAAVSEMGNHLIDSKTPELDPGGPPFTHTFIYGAYDGHITFYEPMITHAFLKGRPNLCLSLKSPEAWEVGGSYPTDYCIRYFDVDGKYTVSLENFVHREAQ